MNKPALIASECYAGLFPRNSLAGFRYALHAGVDGIEFDVHLTRDGHVIVHHDYRLNGSILRNEQGDWISKPWPPVITLSRVDMQHYDVGRYRPGSKEEASSPHYQPVDGEKIPFLDQFLMVCGQAGTSIPDLWIELKTTPFQRDISSDPDTLLLRVLELVDHAGMVSGVTLLAFEWNLLVKAMEWCPGIRTNFLSIDPEIVVSMNRQTGTVDPDLLYGDYPPRRYGHSWWAAIKAAGGTAWGPYFRGVTEEDIVRAQAAGVSVNLWGVGDEDIAGALALKPDSLTLERPDLARGLLDEQ